MALAVVCAVLVTEAALATVLQGAIGAVRIAVTMTLYSSLLALLIYALRAYPETDRELLNRLMNHLRPVGREV